MRTLNGTPCINIGANDTQITKNENGIVYVQVQFFPLVPQRIEWVREDNLKKGEK